MTYATGERKTEHRRTIKNGLQFHFQKNEQNLPQNYLQYKKGVFISEQQFAWTVIIAANKTTRALRIIMRPLA